VVFFYNQLIIEPPGAGKTLMVRAMPGILTKMSFEEALDVTRQPLEDKQVTISRAQWSLTFHSNFQLIAAMNPRACSSV